MARKYIPKQENAGASLEAKVVLLGDTGVGKSASMFSSFNLPHT